MNVRQIAPGLQYWLAPHPEWEPGENWPEHVPSVRWESNEGVVLIDPLLPREETAFWEWVGEPTRILLTSPWHLRSTESIVSRTGATVWAPPKARWKGPNPTSMAELPAGVDALLPDGDDDSALFFLREHRVLVSGDAFSGTGGRFHVFLDEQDRGPYLAWLATLEELPVERVLIGHGEPAVVPARLLAPAIEEAKAARP